MPAFISEVNYDQNANFDFIEVAVSSSIDTTGWQVYYYKDDGTVQTSWSLGSSVATVAGKNVYLIDKNTTGFTDLGSTKGYALVDGSGNLQQFISFASTITAVEGPADGATSTAHGDLTASGQSMQTSDGGATYTMQSTPDPGTIPCYAPGTLIDTARGPRPVETLAVGDLVETLDHGVLPVRWAHAAAQPLEDAGPGGFPVLIRAGAFGPGCPARDLIVNPQHRILVGGCGQLDSVFEAQVFAPAKALTGLPRIRAMTGKRRIEWIHFALDRHEVVTAEGCLS